MSAQTELDQRVADLDQILKDLELLLPPLLAHGLHIISQDPSLFQEQINICHSRLSGLSPENYELGVRILAWFENNYPKKEVTDFIPFNSPFSL